MFDHSQDDTMVACGTSAEGMNQFEEEMAKVGNAMSGKGKRRSEAIEAIVNWIREDDQRVVNLMLSWLHRQDLLAQRDRPSLADMLKSGMARQLGGAPQEVLDRLQQGIEAVEAHDCENCPAYDECDSEHKTERGTKAELKLMSNGDGLH